MIPTLSLSNKWHRLGLWAFCLVVGFVALLVLTTPDNTPAPPQPVAAHVQAAAPTPAPDPAKAQLILELFNPSDQSLTQQLTTTAIEQQIEHALTTSFVLSKCGIINRDAYRDSFRALILYAERTHLAPDAPGAERLVRRISESSATSYALVYSRTECTSPTLPALADQLHRWTQLVLTQ
ncbi:MAG: hypothetical protein ACKVOE_03885 [Rickettsiales bacterium]